MVNLTRWASFRDIPGLQEDLNRLFESRRETEPSVWAPAVDVYEDSDGLTFKFELPEVEAADVQVKLEDGILSVRGERKLEHADKRNSYQRIERAYGAFARSFTLPTTFDADKVTAEAKQGVLRIHVPKRDEAKPRSISVKVN
jgi:HSP20 family protein